MGLLDLRSPVPMHQIVLWRTSNILKLIPCVLKIESNLLRVERGRVEGPAGPEAQGC